MRVAVKIQYQALFKSTSSSRCLSSLRCSQSLGSDQEDAPCRNNRLSACGKTGRTRDEPEDPGESPKIGEVDGNRNNTSTAGAPRSDGYPTGVGVSGDQRRHALSLRIGGVRTGIQAGESMAVSQKPVGPLDGRTERCSAKGSGRARKEEAGGQRALKPAFCRLGPSGFSA